MSTEQGGEIKVRVVVADDHALTRRELAKAIDRHPLLEVVGRAADGEQALAMARELQPDVVLMDIRMPRMDGLQAARLILAECKAAVVLMSAFEDSQYALAAAQVGAAACLAKSESQSALVAAVLAAGAQATVNLE